METEPKKRKKKWGPAENKKRGRRLKEASAPPPGSIWQKAISKNPEERQDGRDGLSLLFLLFEDTLELKADCDGDPLRNLDKWLNNGVSQKVTLDEFARPRHVPGTLIDSFLR
jgi:hypothetical protein